MKSLKLVTVVFILSSILLFAFGCKPKAEKTKDGTESTSTKKADKTQSAIPVETEQVRVGEMLREYEYAASVMGLRESKVSPQIPGKIDYTGPELGEHVTKGQVLVRLNSSTVQAQLNAARGGYNQALAQLNAMRAKAGRPEEIRNAEAGLKAAKTGMEVAGTEYHRQQQLFAAGAVPQAAVDGARASYDAAKAQYQAAKTQYDLLNQSARIESLRVQEEGVKAAAANISIFQNQLRECSIRAPFSGLVVEKLAQIGEYASPGFAVYQIVSDEGVKIQIGVPIEDIKFVTASTDINIESAQGAMIPARILRTVDAANPELRTITVEVTPINQNENLLSGSFAKVHVKYALVKSGNIVPRRAVLSEDSSPFVFIAEGTKAKKVMVELGAFSNTEYHIAKGLTGNEQVIVNGQNYVNDGTEIAVQNTKKDEPKS